MSEAPAPFIVGWEEWVALPGLGLPAIKAKVDTGARTSALHAFRIEPFGPADAPMVRFGVHPVRGRTDIEIFCSAPIADRRDVISSNGERETRYIINTDIEMGGRRWPIEISLTNREGMAYRMLLGRQAIGDDMMVEPRTSFRQPRLSYRLYRGLPRTSPTVRALRMALVSARTTTRSVEQLEAAAVMRGHVLERIDLGRLELDFGTGSGSLKLDGKALEHYDAILGLIAKSDGWFGAAVVRQLELAGSYAVNSGDALDLRANPAALMQALARTNVRYRFPRMPGVLTAASALSETSPPQEASAMPSRYLRALVVGGRVVAMIRRRDGVDLDTGERRYRRARRQAERAAIALGLGLVSIDIEMAEEGPSVVGLSARPTLARIGATSGIDVADAVIGLIEARVGPQARKAVDGSQ
jgi:ribosomal protein S6--L-glutamate ligase